MPLQLNLSNNRLCGVWLEKGWDEHGTQKGNYDAEGITAIADALRVNSGLTSVNVLSNQLYGESADMLLEVKAEKSNLQTLCGLTHEETELNFCNRGLGPGDAMLLAPEISVMGRLTAMDLSSNNLNHVGVSAVCEAIQSNKETKLASLNMGNNRFGPVGAKSMAAMVAVTGALTEVWETCQPTTSYRLFS